MTNYFGTNIAFSALVPALTGQPTYVSAIQYQAPYGRPSQLQPLLERERLTFEFTGSPTRNGHRALVRGERWMVVGRPGTIPCSRLGAVGDDCGGRTRRPDSAGEPLSLLRPKVEVRAAALHWPPLRVATRTGASQSQATLCGGTQGLALGPL